MEKGYSLEKQVQVFYVVPLSCKRHTACVHVKYHFVKENLLMDK